ncbi:hypothetical protein [Prochlorococcus sp. MIT 1341]|uniref:hypothetical protein n=1 Tax=Prochlorococcus sp. MIT 1341 TaxID=3096221 RepID=UPI002A75C7D0|nr:hypothetical protein [Prochlorococcus sp. MIT 1341]
MGKEVNSSSALMARLTISALDRVSEDPSSWKNPIVHRALLVSGLSVLLAATKLLAAEVDQQSGVN